MDRLQSQLAFFAQLNEPFTGEGLFDHLTDTVYFIKDSQGRYVAANQTLADRCGLAGKEELIERTPDEVLPEPLGQEYRRQDEEILQKGKPILNQLELHIAPSLKLVWCLTTKVPLYGKAGQVVGLAGVSRDLKPHDKNHDDFHGIAEVASHIKKHYDQTLFVDDLAKMAGLSAYQLEQRMQKIFHLTAGQFIQKTRIEAAVWKLHRTDDPVINISLACGYADQSAFSRQFKKIIGLSPAQYRRVVRKNDKA